jgi:FkbM family methyltransferase
MRSVRRRAEILSWIGNRLGKPPGFERLVRFLAPPEKCAELPEVCLCHDSGLFVTRLGLPIGWHVGFFGSYEPELRDIMRTVLAADAVAIDVGANVGWHTLLMARLVGARGRVLAFEPNPSVRDQLLRNVQLNRLGQVEIMSCALAETPGVLNFFAPVAGDPASASGHIVSPENLPSGSIRVEASTLDLVAAEKQLGRIDFVKIDAEGYEWPVLQGAQETIARFRPFIIFEFDRAYAVRGGESSAHFGEFFRKHGYRLFSVGRNWAELIDVHNFPANANIFAVPSE